MSDNPVGKLSSAGLDFTPTIHNNTYPSIDPTKTNLQGKSVLITGASKGVGRATALSFAKAGASPIIVAARSSLDSLIPEIKLAAQKANRPEPKIIPLKLDVTDESSVAAATETIASQSKNLDILINNAGYLESPWLPVAQSTPTDWWTSMTTNIKGTYLVTRAFLPLLLASPTKTILNISSVGAHRIAPGASAYQTAKLAICRFTEFLVVEYGKEGLNALAVHPGGVKTELAHGMPDWMHAVLIDEPELSADSMVWLASERREWLSGRYVSCTWDVDELQGKKEKILEGNLLKVRMAVEF
ncbi:oxidoreductase-like protein [Venturia nashicola]|nr:oxidoreductase-like protein [Venturia nashicola]